ncbi:hypothetical protein [Nocardia suismassiliense]|uniref:hypothetical protein n=1 Tax=Nocardia suismassiliense TaxID=2077092 RepID=UPI00131F3E46|nr:hypothetical protein [Nocardia suismassiliense]
MTYAVPQLFPNPKWPSAPMSALRVAGLAYAELLARLAHYKPTQDHNAAVLNAFTAYHQARRDAVPEVCAVITIAQRCCGPDELAELGIPAGCEWDPVNGRLSASQNQFLDDAIARFAAQTRRPAMTGDTHP